MSLTKVFIIQTVAFCAAYAFFGRQKELPLSARLITLCVYMTSPMYVAIKGAQSAVYISDLLLPIMIVGVFLSPAIRRGTRDNIWRNFAILLFVLPLLAGVANFLLGGGKGQLDSRDTMGVLIWFYRNSFFLMLLLYGMSVRLDEDKLGPFIRLNLALSSVLVIFGVINYIGGINLAIYDQLLATNNSEGMQYISLKRASWGFLGLSRASVGQWFATTLILLLGLISLRNVGNRITIALVASLSIGLVLFSYSRAGVLGMGAGLIVLGLVGRERSQRTFVILGLLCAAGWVLWQYDVVGSRLESITAVNDIASAGRLEAWQRGLHFLIRNPSAMFFGVGPTNQAAVFSITHAWGAHNEYVDSIFRMGILGLFCIFLLIGMMARRFQKVRNAGPRTMQVFGATMLAVLAANVVMGFTQEHLLHNYSGYTFGAFLYWVYGVALGASTSATGGETHQMKLGHNVGHNPGMPFEGARLVGTGR